MTMMMAADISTVDWGEVFGAGANLGTAAGLIFILGRLALALQKQLVDGTGKQNETLAERLEAAAIKADERQERQDERYLVVQKRLDESMEGHRHCEAELSAHRLESARLMAEMRLEASRQLGELQAEVRELQRRLDRPRRSSDVDPDGE